ncbi:MAG: SusC/RagA family TonB-linked outer membrane protein [Bacteroidia bacterium]|nr:SusC/RagA family TonB-linked outer membrane protein [Bacteroidia bacterium]
MRKKVNLLLFLFLVSIGITLAQTRVRGHVADENGEPVIGASIQVKGTGQGTVTDVDGNFSLSAQAKGTLVVSYVGMKTQEVAVSANPRIILQSDIELLDEVVITGEFGMKRIARSVGSSVQNVKASDIIDSGRDNFISALQGRVSGLNVTSSGGTPGASNTVTLRSLTSISGNNQPLYVVDGIPMNNSSFNVASGFAVADVYASRNLDFSSRGDDFNPEDIESLTILKGAAAAALYGSNAANGAIIITTKKGTSGRGKVSYSNSFRWDNAYGYPEPQTKYANGAYGATNYYNLSRYGGLYPDGTNFYDNVGAILQTGLTTRHNVSVETGTEKLTLRAGASFTNQTGIVKTTDYSRKNLSLSGKAQITDWLKFEASMQYAGTTNNKAKKGTAGPLFFAMQWPLIDDMSNYMDADGMHMRYPERYIDGDLLNPLFMLYKNKYYDESDRIIANAVAIINPTKNTFVRAQIGWDVGAQTFETSEHPYWRTYNYTALPGKGGTYNMSKSNFSDPTLNFLAGWNDEFMDKKLTLSAQVEYHQLENGVTQLSTYGANYKVVELQSINNTEPSTVISKKRTTMRRVQAFSGQAEIGYNNMAFLTLRARNDWSSTLPKENNRYFYPAAEFAFVATELPFLKDNKVVNYLKIRGALARVGKDAGPLEINPELVAEDSFGPAYHYGYTGPNPNLKPEMTTSREIGFEGRFFNDRVVADFTYFKTRSDNQIIKDFRMSYAGGFILNTQNMGSFETWGWESHIDGDIINMRNGLRWNLGFNLSHADSKVISLPVEMFYDAYTWNSGNIRNGVILNHPLTSVVGNDFQRNDKGEVLINPATGIPLVAASGTLSYLGNREPKFRFGISTFLTYKGFRLSGIFSGKLNTMVVNGTKRYMMQNGLSWESVAAREQGPVVFKGVLRDGLENTDNPTVNTIAVTYGNYSSGIYSGADPNWIEKNVNYMRLQELRLSYTIPPHALKKFTNGFISYATLSISGNDLVTWTNYSGIDAVGNTVSAAAGGVGGEGYDTWAIPSPRGITCGVSLTF